MIEIEIEIESCQDGSPACLLGCLVGWLLCLHACQGGAPTCTAVQSNAMQCNTTIVFLFIFKSLFIFHFFFIFPVPCWIKLCYLSTCPVLSCPVLSVLFHYISCIHVLYVSFLTGQIG
ncbi:hypothetical protein M432DRAFT_26168 [Thermoascus aurantiacus ATCC 26904]